MFYGFFQNHIILRPSFRHHKSKQFLSAVFRIILLSNQQDNVNRECALGLLWPRLISYGLAVCA